jgi:hypothetical protein
LIILTLCVFIHEFVDTTVHVYFTDFVGSVSLQGDASASENSTLYQNYQTGIKYGTFGFLELLIIQAVCGIMLEKFDKGF